MSQPTPEDSFELIRKMWGNMGFGMPGMSTPTLDVEELARRIKDLQAVEGWLKMNLGMLQMSIQGLEMQRNTLQAMQAMRPQGGEQAEPGANPFTHPAMWTWPFAPAPSAAPGTDPEPPQEGGKAAP